jgi:hypothetical protein
MCHSTLHALLGSESHFRGQRSGNIIVNSLRWRAQRRSWYVECLCKATTDAEELSIQATLGKKFHWGTRIKSGNTAYLVVQSVHYLGIIGRLELQYLVHITISVRAFVPCWVAQTIGVWHQG